MSNHIAAGFTHPDNMTRKDKLQYIAYLKQAIGYDQACKWWLTHGSRISRTAFESA